MMEREKAKKNSLTQPNNGPPAETKRFAINESSNFEIKCKLNYLEKWFLEYFLNQIQSINEAIWERELSSEKKILN